MFINTFSNSIISFTECTISCTLYPWSVRYWWGKDKSWCPNYYYCLGSDGLFYFYAARHALVRCGSKRVFVVVWRIFALVYFPLLLITCQTGQLFTSSNKNRQQFHIGKLNRVLMNDIWLFIFLLFKLCSYHASKYSNALIFLILIWHWIKFNLMAWLVSFLLEGLQFVFIMRRLVFKVRSIWVEQKKPFQSKSLVINVNVWIKVLTWSHTKLILSLARLHPSVYCFVSVNVKLMSSFFFVYSNGPSLDG